MRKHILCLLIIIPALVSGQEFYKNESGKIVYERTFDKPNLTKEDLFSYSKRWIANTFESAEAVIQTEDKEFGEIIGNGTTNVVGLPDKRNRAESVDLKFKILINVKDGAARVRIYDIHKYYISNITHDVNTVSLEVLDKNSRENRTQKELEPWLNLVSNIKNSFNLLLEDYGESIDAYHKDKF